MKLLFLYVLIYRNHFSQVVRFESDCVFTICNIIIFSYKVTDKRLNLYCLTITILFLRFMRNANVQMKL